MLDGSVYYCWSCDAHRKVAAEADRRLACPRCGKPLTEDSRLSRPTERSAGPRLVFDFLASAAAREFAAA
jgi:hypothetical protein